MSAPTTATDARMIRLTYDLKKDIVTSEPSSPLKFKVGEYLEFDSSQGPVTVDLKPASAYKPSVYHTGSEPVRVVKKVAGKIWCTVFNTTPGGAKSHVGYPKNKRYGVDVRP